MNSKQSGVSKVWALAILVVAAAGALIVLGDKFPPADENIVSGSIVPAERYRNNQIDSEDVILEGDATPGSGAPVEDNGTDALVAAADEAERADNATSRGMTLAEKAERAERAEKADNARMLAEKAERAERAEKADNARMLAEKAERAERAEKADQAVGRNY